jgi:EPS-associated MarR family transcriptional regulator
MPPVLSDESRYRILRLIEQNPTISQREIARELGISLGKANFCLRALIEKGVLKANTFLNSRNKRAFAYVFTPSGIEDRARITLRFLKKKMGEYEALQREIAELSEQAQKLRASDIQEKPELVAVPNRASDTTPMKRLTGIHKKPSQSPGTD